MGEYGEEKDACDPALQPRSRDPLCSPLLPVLASFPRMLGVTSHAVGGSDEAARLGRPRTNAARSVITSNIFHRYGDTQAAFCQHHFLSVFLLGFMS